MRIKKEAGNRGVVCRRSGLYHREVSNTDCLFVVVVVVVGFFLFFTANVVGFFFLINGKLPTKPMNS